MRLILLSLVVAACSHPTPAPTPSYAPVETVTVRANVGETARRLVAIYTADQIQVASATGGTVTTATVGVVPLAVGSGASGVTGSVSYFYRATIVGDTVSTVTLAFWARFVSRVGSDPESPPDDGPVTATCARDPKCAVYLERMKRHAETLRDHR